MNATLYDLILFDVDDTLLDFGAAQEQALAAVVSHSGLPASPTWLEDFRRINHDLWLSFEAGSVSQSTVFTRRFELLFEEALPAVNAADCNEVFLANLGNEPTLLSGAKELCFTLKSAHPLGIVSNGHGPTQRRRLDKAGLAPAFSFVLISQEVGYQKPQAEIFLRALATTGLTSDARVLMIGDNLKADIAGAQGVGFDTCWLRSSGRATETSVKPTFVIDHLSEVARLPGVASR